jgi:hypothetical protein
MSSNEFAPGTLVVLRRDAAKQVLGKGFIAQSKAHMDFAKKFSGKACVALVHKNDGKGSVEITLAHPIEQNYCGDCRSKLHVNRTTNLRSCTQCNRGYGVRPTKLTAKVKDVDIHIPVTLVEQD